MLDKSADKFVVAHSKCRWMMMESNLLLLLLLPKLLPLPAAAKGCFGPGPAARQCAVVGRELS